MQIWFLILFFLSAISFAQQRVISTAGNASEIVALLGEADKLVGVDTTSMQPLDVMKDKPKIGYRRQLSAEGILSLNPDLILLAADAGAPAVVEQLKNSGVKLLNLTEEQSLEGIRMLIEQIGNAVSTPEKTQLLLERVKHDEVNLRAALHEAGNPQVNALILLDTSGQGVFGLGKNSAGDKLIQIFGWHNAFNIDGHKPIATEALATSDASVIFIATRNDAKESFIVRPLSNSHPQVNTLLLTSAAQRECVFEVNILAALGFGANTARDYLEIFQAVKPCISGGQK